MMSSIFFQVCICFRSYIRTSGARNCQPVASSVLQGKLGTQAWGVTPFLHSHLLEVHVGKRMERQIILDQPHIMMYDMYNYIYIHRSVYIDRYSCCCLVLIFLWQLRKKCWACLWFASTTFSPGFVQGSLPLIQMAIAWWQRHADRRPPKN